MDFYFLDPIIYFDATVDSLIKKEIRVVKNDSSVKFIADFTQTFLNPFLPNVAVLYP